MYEKAHYTFDFLAYFTDFLYLEAGKEDGKYRKYLARIYRRISPVQKRIVSQTKN